MKYFTHFIFAVLCKHLMNDDILMRNEKESFESIRVEKWKDCDSF